MDTICYKIKIDMFFYDVSNRSNLWIHLHGLFSNVWGNKVNIIRNRLMQERNFSFFAMDMDYEESTTTYVLNFLEVLIRGFSLHYDRIVMCGSSHGAYVVSNYVRYRYLGNLKEIILLAPSFETLSLIKKHSDENLDEWLDGKKSFRLREEDREITFCQYFAKDIIDKGYEILDGDKVNFPENPPIDIKIAHGVNDEVIPIERTRLFVSKVHVKTYIEVEDDHRLDKSINYLLDVFMET